MTTIIDYKSGNIRSLSNALDRLGAEYVISSDANQISAADCILFPGQGNIDQVMKSLKQLGLIEPIKSFQKPFLGICVGMQLLYGQSEEENTKGLEIIPGTVRRFDESDQLKIPQMGWNTVIIAENDPLFAEIANETYLYFANSFVAPVNDFTLAKSQYGREFTAVCRSGNFYGVQFHPEKSGPIGLQLLKNFLSLSYANHSSSRHYGW